MALVTGTGMNGKIRKPTEQQAIYNIEHPHRKPKRVINVLTEEDIKRMDERKKPFSKWIIERLAEEEQENNGDDAEN